MAKTARDTLYRGLSLVERATKGGRNDLLPPAHLRLYYYRTMSRRRFATMCDGARTELVTRGLQPHHRLLDIGSGIGNLALGLTKYLEGGYDGIDIHPEAVAWCQRAITLRHPRFRFHRADVASRAYNPQGTAAPTAYRFPFPDDSFDFVFVGSVFTHMMPDDVAHYVAEISRTLRPDGVCIASYFLINDDTRSGVTHGDSFISFAVPHPTGVCRLHDAVVPEAAVAFEEDFVRAVHTRAGLTIRDVRRGHWWSGAAHDQDLLTVEPTGAAGGGSAAHSRGAAASGRT